MYFHIPGMKQPKQRIVSSLCRTCKWYRESCPGHPDGPDKNCQDPDVRYRGVSVFDKTK